jgi:hypothetical protein
MLEISRKNLEEKPRQIKDIITEKTKERWEGKRMHGQFPCSLDRKLVDNERSYRWLKFRDMKGETESTTVAAQDQSVQIILKTKF